MQEYDKPYSLQTYMSGSLRTYMRYCKKIWLSQSKISQYHCLALTKKERTSWSSNHIALIVTHFEEVVLVYKERINIIGVEMDVYSVF